MNENQLSNQIIGLAIKVHKTLGPGLYENVYKDCLFYELSNSGLLVEKEKPVSVTYENHVLDCSFRMDLFVEKKVVLEIKSVEEITRIHMTQLLTYLKFSQAKLGLLMNFNVALLSQGIKRVVLNL
ncbi:MAG TPA: GxxExxY protein [Bacteroidales bacterium]|nr:GxxExxY protein [Bacteroidales bacterium]